MNRAHEEKVSKRERGKQPLFFLFSLFCFSPLPAPPPPPPLLLSVATFFFVCARLGIFRLPGHIMPCFLMQSCHSIGLYHLFINEFIYWFIKFNSLRLA